MNMKQLKPDIAQQYINWDEPCVKFSINLRGIVPYHTTTQTDLCLCSDLVKSLTIFFVTV